jgi:tetratricopeptide (TPR) repeat protein
MKTPLDAEAYYNRAMSKLQQGDFSGAIADFTKSIEIEPDNFMAHVQRAYTRSNLKDYNGAIADYVQVVVHLFQRESREFYDLEGLWNDAAITSMPS